MRKCETLIFDRSDLIDPKIKIFDVDIGSFKIMWSLIYEANLIIFFDDQNHIILKNRYGPLSDTPHDRYIRNGDTGPLCPVCKSSLYKKHWWSIRRHDGPCLNSYCENYWNLKKSRLI